MWAQAAVAAQNPSATKHNVARTATLVEQQAAGDGKMINLWGGNTEIAANRVTQAIID